MIDTQTYKCQLEKQLELQCSDLISLSKSISLTREALKKVNEILEEPAPIYPKLGWSTDNKDRRSKSLKIFNQLNFKFTSKELNKFTTSTQSTYQYLDRWLFWGWIRRVSRANYEKKISQL